MTEEFLGSGPGRNGSKLTKVNPAQLRRHENALNQLLETTECLTFLKVCRENGLVARENEANCAQVAAKSVIAVERRPDELTFKKYLPAQRRMRGNLGAWRHSSAPNQRLSGLSRNHILDP